MIEFYPEVEGKSAYLELHFRIDRGLATNHPIHYTDMH